MAARQAPPPMGFSRVLERGAIDFSKNGLESVNLIQMTIVSITVGKNPLEEME